MVTARPLGSARDLAAEFGVKAAELGEFAQRCADHGYAVPRSWLVPVSAVDRALAPVRHATPRLDDGTPDRDAPDHGAPEHDEPRYGVLPRPEAAPDGWARLAEECGMRLESLLAALPRPASALLRTSVTWPDPRARPPGIDVTVAADDGRRGARLWEGVHKAYAHLCRRLRGEAGPPRFGLMATERVPARFEGTAYVTPAGLAVEMGVLGGGSMLAGSPAELDGLVPAAVSARLFGQLAELAGDAPEGRLVEVEFLLDGDHRLVPAQRRELAMNGLAPFHTPRKWAGPALDLRRVGRDVDVLRRSLAGGPGGPGGPGEPGEPGGSGGSGQAVVLPLHDGSRLDLFALLWTLDREPGLPPPAALILTRDATSHAGMPTHLRWLAATMLNGTAIYYLPGHDVPDGLRRVSISSDGVRAWLTA
ncbi:hypothetical protein J5X84_14810 [Streptosporangiaceae bacterium NEAU-GS5]|nr:hypothetical protein [Streptosporangiaceae bacterium NEAU-GS5]